MAEAKAMRAPHGPARLPSKKRLRPEAWLKALEKGQLVEDLKTEIKHWHSSREPPRIQSPDVYEHLEIMLANVHSFTNYLFKDPSWSFDRVEMLDPSGSTGEGGSWKRFSDQVWGVSSLFRQGHKYEGSVKLRCLLLEAADTIDPADPQILVRIWRISRYLLGICKSLGNNNTLRKVMTYLRDSVELKAVGGKENPAVKLLDTLANMDVYYLNWALMGFSIENRGGIVGYYDKALEMADQFCGPDSDTALSILHDFTYFVHYSNNQEISPTAAGLASQLWDKTNLTMLAGQNVWSAKTQYFTFASQVLAESCLRQGNTFWATWYIEYAVHLLRQSDRECQIRADMLLARLHRWLRAWGEHDSAEAVSARRKVLMQSINKLLAQEIDEFYCEVCGVLAALSNW
ncbi:uncharacterized protein BDV14DRAFT_201100 [Aspergillus stella-maris]|uniref:uncharacterized protein n=1 Tax=Aspergillus stella-maris TaxID=1810926 RepID=UPI003CCDBFE1